MRGTWSRRLVGLCGLTAGLVGCLALGGEWAGAQSFGQNRVPVVRRDWRVLTSEHIELHYYEDERAVAEEALRIAERAFARLSRIHRHTPQRRIPVLLYGSPSEFSETPVSSSPLDEGTGGLTEFFKRRVIVPATGSPAELDHVLSHELEHAFQLDMLSGDEGLSIQALRWMPPLWVMEGLCEYLSVPGLDPNTEMWLRDAALSGRLIDLGTLAYVGDLRVYRFGQAVVAFIAERFGEDAVGLWWQAIVHRRSLERGTAESIGLTMERLSESWQEWVRTRYLPGYAERRAPADEGRPLTRHEGTLINYHVAPALSPDGGEVVFVADEAPYADLFIASALDGSHRRRLIRGAREESFESLRFYRSTVDWHPGGDRLALIAKSNGRDRLVLFQVRTREVEERLDFGFDEMTSPAWSPDGGRLAFVGQRAGESALYVVGADGEGLARVWADRWAVLQPAWSPDGGRIAFVTDCEYGTLSPERGSSPWRIAILDLASGERRLLPQAPGKSLSPQWFPDGRHLLFVSDRDGVSDLFVHDLETGSEYELTRVRTGICGITPNGPALSLSDDGHRLVFSAYHDGGWDLYAIQDPLGRMAGKSPWQAPTPEEPPAEASTDAPGDSPAVAQMNALVEAPGDSPALAQMEAPAASPIDSLAAGEDTPPSPDAADGAPADSLAAGEPGPLRAPPVLDLGALFADTAEFPDSMPVEDRRYRPRLTLDYLEAGGLYASGYGAIAQTVIGLSDILGNRRLLIGLDVNGALEEGNYYVGYVNQSRRPALSVAAYQYLTGYGYSAAPGSPEIYRKRLLRGVGAGLQYPLSRFRRLELYVDALHETRYHWDCETASSSDLVYCGWEDESGSLLYAVPEIAYVHDTALFGSTGPLSGRRARISAGTYLGERQAHGLEADLRFYWNLRKRYAFVVRGVFAGEWGPDRERLAFGGPYSLRGHSDHPLYGTSLAFANLEFRFPFIEDLRVAWPLPLGFYGIRGALFCDLGAAWDDPNDFRAVRSGADGGKLRLEDLRAACGFRAAINLGFTVLRWDLARRTDFAGWIGKPKGEVSIGWEF